MWIRSEMLVLTEECVDRMKATETKALEYIGAVAGKCWHDDGAGVVVDKDAHNNMTSKDSWSEGTEDGQHSHVV